MKARDRKKENLQVMVSKPMRKQIVDRATGLDLTISEYLRSLVERDLEVKGE